MTNLLALFAVCFFRFFFCFLQSDKLLLDADLMWYNNYILTVKLKTHLDSCKHNCIAKISINTNIYLNSIAFATLRLKHYTILLATPGITQRLLCFKHADYLLVNKHTFFVFFPGFSSSSDDSSSDDSSSLSSSEDSSFFFFFFSAFFFSTFFFSFYTGMQIEGMQAST